jgi:FAD/FMN-containing dehydrogenase
MKDLVAFSISVLAIAERAIATAQVGSLITTPLGSFELTKGAVCACSKLSRAYSGIISPNGANYTAQAADAYWDVRANLSPACIFLPSTADEISKALDIFQTCDAQFAVRGGGHMNVSNSASWGQSVHGQLIIGQYPGSNSIDGGVLLALEKLDTIKVNAESVEVGPGLTWYDVYEALEPYGRVTIGGRMKTIGVPGLSLIGGFHYFNNKYGYAMDNVLSYDVTLGNGTQVVANKTSHPDLFWALKGGANNYGIVTKFTLKTYAIPKISTTIQVFNESGIPDFLAAVCNIAKLDEDDPIAAGMVATVPYNATTKVASASLLGVQEGISKPPSQFANFSAIPATTRINNITTMRQWASSLDTPKQLFRLVTDVVLALERNLASNTSYSVMFSHKTMKPDQEVLISIYKAWKDAVDEIADVEGLYPTFVTNVASASAARVALTNGVGNVWGLEAEPYIRMFAIKRPT